MYSSGLKCTDLWSLSTCRRLEDDEYIIMVDEYIEGDDNDDDV